MASLSSGQYKTKPWRARRKRDGIEYLIGYFETKEQAEQAEAGFDSAWPGRRDWLKGLRRHVDFGYNRRVAS